MPDQIGGKWRRYPGAVEPRADLAPVEPGRVIGVGAICDVRAKRDDDPCSMSFSVAEFVTLSGGRRVILHEERGFTLGGRGPRAYCTREMLVRNALNAVLPDENETVESHPWVWLAERARARGIDVTPGDLRQLEYQVIFSNEVATLLAACDG